MSKGGGSSGKWIQPPMTEEEEALMRFQLAALSAAQGVKYPLRDVFGVTPTEQYAEELMGEYVRSPISPALIYSLGSMFKQATTPVDLTKIPEYAGILERVGEEGSLEAGRLARGLQLGGAAQGSKGRDILGRSTTDTQLKMLSALAPFGEAERSRQFEAKASVIPTLVEAIDAQTLRKIAAPESYGTRDILQSILDAAYTQSYQQATLPLSVAQLAVSAQPKTSSYAYQPGTSESSIWPYLLGLGGAIALPFLFSGFGGGGGTYGSYTPYGGFTTEQMYSGAVPGWG